MHGWKGMDDVVRHAWSVDFDTSGWSGVLFWFLSLNVFFTLLISPSMRFDLRRFPLAGLLTTML